MSRHPGKSNAANKVQIQTLRNEMKCRAAQAKFIMIIVYDREGVRMSLQYGEVINNMWQSLKEKTDRKLSIEVTL